MTGTASPDGSGPPGTCTSNGCLKMPGRVSSPAWWSATWRDTPLPTAVSTSPWSGSRWRRRQRRRRSGRSQAADPSLSVAGNKRSDPKQTSSPGTSTIRIPSNGSTGSCWRRRYGLYSGRLIRHEVQIGQMQQSSRKIRNIKCDELSFSSLLTAPDTRPGASGYSSAASSLTQQLPAHNLTPLPATVG